MYRGTTPCLKLHLNTKLDLSEVSQIWVTIKGIGLKITKYLEDVDFNAVEKLIYVNLTQEETLQADIGKVQIQVRFYMKNGKAFATNIVEREFEYILEGGIISDSSEL